MHFISNFLLVTKISMLLILLLSANSSTDNNENLNNVHGCHGKKPIIVTIATKQPHFAS